MPSEPFFHPAPSSVEAAASVSGASGMTAGSMSFEIMSFCVVVSAKVGEMSLAVFANASELSCLRLIASATACRTAGSVCGPEHPRSVFAQVIRAIWFCPIVMPS